MKKYRFRALILTVSLALTVAIHPRTMADEGTNGERLSNSDNSSQAMSSLDDQVQQIKSDVLAISAELSILEEQLLYPSNTQFALFLAMSAEQPYRLDALHLRLDGNDTTHQIYSFKELEALQLGGVQRLYTGNIARGEHTLQIELLGKGANGKVFNHVHDFSFSKGIEPSMLGVTLAGSNGSSVSLTDW
jgi:hypothetical protein